MRRFCYTLLLFLVACSVQGQMLLTESLTMVIDTAKWIQGSIAPELGFRTEKKEIFNLKNTANLNLMVGKNRALTILNKLEFSTYGSEVHVSEGFVHIEYRNLLRPYIEVYPYLEAQWAGSRGMQIRAVGGVQLRLHLIQTKHLVWTSGAGFFYEYEKWRDDELPQTPRRAETHHAKVQLFASFKLLATDHIELITSGYYQGQLSRHFLSPRYAVGVDLKYKFTSHFALWGSYMFFYDQEPPIAISKPYTTLTSGVLISF